MKTAIIPNLGSRIALIALSGLALYATHVSQRYLTSSHEKRLALSEALYLPQKETIRLLSFGYHNVAANYLWFRTINYFGKHYVKDQNYEWLFHMCTLVATLNPKALHVYEFGSTILAWEAGHADLAARLLTQGIQENPNSWKLRYLRGFNAYYFLNDPERAKNDFIEAAKLPDAHPIAARLAAKTLATQDDTQQAIEFLSDTLRATTDASVKQVLLERLRELHYEDDLRTLEHALNRYQTEYGRTPNTLVEITPFLSRQVSGTDPFGGEYSLGPGGSSIVSSSKRKRLGVKK